MLGAGYWVLGAGELDVIKYPVSSIQYRSEATKVSSIGAKRLKYPVSERSDQ